MARRSIHAFPSLWELTDTLRGMATRMLTRSRHTPILVASLGRSGSTMICESIIRGKCEAIGLTYREWMLFEPAWIPGEVTFRPGGVYKTHFYKRGIPENTKIVFVYDDAYQIVGSLLTKLWKGEQDWLMVHGRHLTGRAVSVEKMIAEDVFKLRDNFLSWTSKEYPNVFYVHYDDIWSRKVEIENFLDIKLSMPKREHRSNYLKVLPEKDKMTLMDTYGPLQEIIEAFRISTT